MRAPILSLLLLAAVLCPTPVRAQLSVDVNAALGRSVQLILHSQRDDGSFGPIGALAGATASYPLGSTALATYALRKSGLQPTHPALVSAARYLMDQPFGKTYSVSALVLALHALGQPEHEARILEAAVWLEAHQDERSGLWAYPAGEVDLSNTQFAVLALKTAALHGHETKSRLWADVIDGALKYQRKDGGFFYRDNYWPEVSGTMTTAGLTTLYVALRFLEDAGQNAPQQKLARDAIEHGWSWLDARFSASGGPMGHAGLFADRYPDFGRSDEHHYYYLYGMERVATFAERETVGGIPWYPASAAEMLAHESAEGGWGTLENTCLAMLVLRRATISGGHTPAPESAAQDAGAVTAAATGSVTGAVTGAVAGDVTGAATGAVAGDESSLAADKPATASDSDAGSGATPGGAGALWAYTTDEPRKKWFEPDFDDSRWPRGTGGFAGGGATGLVMGTPWETHDLWVRRRFTWSGSRDDLGLFVIHDDAVQIWINGEEAVTGAGWSGGRYKEFAISEAARRSLHKGENVLAAWVHDDGGGRSLDIRFTRPTGLHDRPDAWDRSLPRPDVPFVRRWDLLGPLDDEDHAALLDLALPAAVASGRKLGKRAWTTQRSLGNRLWVNEALGGRPGTCSYASIWLHVGADVQAYLWLGVADGVRAWLDGQPLLLHHVHGAAPTDPQRVPLELRAGARQLVLLVEQQGPECPLRLRVAGLEGEPIDDLRYALSGDELDETQIALAQPDLFDLPGLALRLPVANASVLRFDRLGDIDNVAFSGVTDDEPRWIVKTSDKLPAPQPPSGARGVLTLLPPSTDRPARLIARIEIGARDRTLSAVVALAEGAAVGGRLRLMLYDDTLHTLLDTDLAPDASSGRAGFTRLAADLGAPTGPGALCILEWSALPGQDPQPLYVDELSLR